MAFVKTDDKHYHGIADAIRGMHGQETTYTPPEMVDFLNAGKVNLKPWNIAKGITIMGVTGTMETESNDWPTDPDFPSEEEFDEKAEKDDPDIDKEDYMLLVDNDGNITKGYLYTAENSDMMLYNGVALPALPDADYKYAVIFPNNIESDVPNLFLSNEECTIFRVGNIDANHWVWEYGFNQTSLVYECTSAGWVQYTSSETHNFRYTVIVEGDTVPLPLWSNYDIVKVSKGIDFKASDPVPYSQMKVYNGHVLPDIETVWDKEAYPYAYITSLAMGNSSNKCLIVSKVDRRAYQPDGLKSPYLLFASSTEAGEETAWYKIVDGKWESRNAGTTFYRIFWCNEDCYYADSVEEVGGTLAVAASTPTEYKGFEITWYDPITTEFKAIGWRRVSKHTTGELAGTITTDDFTRTESGGWNYLKNIRSCTREKLYYKGVEVWPNCSQTWSYNGVVLPALLDLEYNGNTYPYVFMVKEKVSSIPYCVRASMDKTYIQEGQLSDGRITESIYINYPFLLTRHSENPNDVWSYYDNDLEQYVYGEWTRHTSEEWGNKPSAPTMTISIDGEPTGANIIWSNHDILYPDGTVFFAASDPIPIK